MVETSSGVTFLHGQGVEYRDLKLENIMICINEEQQPHIKVGDFGLAKVLADCSTIYRSVVVQNTSWPLKFTKVAIPRDIFSMGMIFCCIVPRVCWSKFDDKKYLCKK